MVSFPVKSRRGCWNLVVGSVWSLHLIISFLLIRNAVMVQLGKGFYPNHPLI